MAKHPHRLQGKAFKQAREARTDAVCQHGSYRHKKVRRYYVINVKTNRRSENAVTMETFLNYVDRKQAVASQYQLVEAR